MRQQFTSYERDSESGLDFAEARFYSSVQGRFTSIDPLIESAVTANPQTFNRYSYVSNSPINIVDPTGMFGISPGESTLGGIGSLGNFSLNQQSSEVVEQPQQTQGMPPPPGHPITPGPIIIDIGPPPLMAGEEPWPTTIEVVQGQNKTYNGDPIISPSGEVIDPEPNYGIGMTVDYIIRNQVGEPMSQGVLVTETLTGTNPQGQALRKLIETNTDPQRPDTRGIVPDTLGFVGRDPTIFTFLQQNQINATFTHTITVHGTFGKEYRTALTLQHSHVLTNAGVTMTVGPVQQRARPK